MGNSARWENIMQNFHKSHMKYERILYMVILLGACSICGCLFPSASNESGPPTPPEDAKVIAIADSLSDASKEDCIKIYGIFTAFSQYVKDGHKGVDNTKQMLDLWKNSLDNLGWDKEKYSKFTDAVEVELKSRGLEDPKPMSEAKSTVVEAFELIANGCKHAAINADLSGE